MPSRKYLYAGQGLIVAAIAAFWLFHTQPACATCQSVNLAPGFFVSTASNTPAGSDTNPGTLSSPFLTLTKCQTAMRGSSTQKTCYVRGGAYAPAQVANCDGDGVPCVLDLQAADTGTTWQYYPLDGVNTANIDGQSTAEGNGMFYMISVHTANITINGLKLRRFQYAGVHSGSGASSGLTVMNSDIGNGTTTTLHTAPAAVSCFGCANMTVSHNYIHDMGAWGVNLANSNGVPNNMIVDSNFFQNICTGRSDCSAIYLVDCPGGSGCPATSTGHQWTNNYIRDGNTFATLGSGFGSAMYLDDCGSNATVTGNTISGRNGSNSAMLIHGGNHNKILNNIIDLSTFQQSIMAVQSSTCNDNTMNDETFSNNIVIGTGPGGGFNNLSGAPAFPTTINNDYFPYADGAISHTGNWSDTNASTVDPQLTCWTYVIASTSPVLSPPTNFGDLCRTWGPPGFAVPQTGTAPSSPTSCTLPISVVNLTNGASNTTNTVYQTAFVAPQASRLDIVSVASQGNGEVPTLSGAGGTWVAIGHEADATNHRMITLFRDLSGTPNSGVLQINFSAAQSNVAWSVDEFANVDTTGTHGSGALVQSAVGTVSSGAASTGISLTLAALQSSASASYGAVRTDGSNTIIKGGAFTELANISLPKAEAEWATNQTVVNWTWASQSVISVAMAVEVKHAP